MAEIGDHQAEVDQQPSEKSSPIEDAQVFAREHREVYLDADAEIAPYFEQAKRGEISLDELRIIVAAKIGAEKSNHIQAKLGQMEAVANSDIDSLTQLPMAETFNSYLEGQIKELISGKKKGILRVTFADMDKFGIFNTTYGQDRGNEVIKEFVGQLKDSVRSDDMVARYGGEEFVVAQLIRPDLQERTLDLTNPAERMRRSIDMQVESGPQTASFGTTTYIEGDTHRTLTARANVANTIAKFFGKNRTVDAIAQPGAGVVFSDLSVDEDGHRVGKDYDVTYDIPKKESDAPRLKIIRELNEAGDGKIYDVIYEEDKKPYIVERIPEVTNG